jgi:hypothetical protein
MTEDFLHYIWKFQNFDKTALLSEQGAALHIVQSGFHNHHAGPDFQDARVLIDTELWAGNVELHLDSSDWQKHKHDQDPAYNNVILHVVYEHDKEVFNQNGQALPTLVLKGRFDEYLYWRYEQLVQNSGSIPCATHFSKVEPLLVESMLERVLTDRIARKAEDITTLLAENGGDWEETAYQWLSACFGLKINAEPMLWLAKALPLKIVKKHANEPALVQALLFGTAGFLEGAFYDPYPAQLKLDYAFLQHKYQLNGLEEVVWNYGKLRPFSFPEQRLAQWSSFLCERKHLFKTMIETGEVEQLFAFFEVSGDTYWSHHFRFEKPSAQHSTATSRNFITRLISNGVVPFLFAYGKHVNEDFYTKRALDLLDQLPPEHNKVVGTFEHLGVQCTSAFDTQALLELKRAYCNLKKCLNCAIGNQILKRQV